MEGQLQQIQEFINDNQLAESIDQILELYLQKTKCEFTNYQKIVLPICAAYYAILETREIEAETQRNKEQQTPGTPDQEKDADSPKGSVQTKKKQSNRNQQNDSKIVEESQQNSTACQSPSERAREDSSSKIQKATKVTVMELSNKFYKKGQLDQLLKTMTEFSQGLQGREYSEIINSKLESIKRNHSLFIKFSHVLDCFYSDTEIFQKQLMQRVIWRLYLLLKEQLHQEQNEVDIEECAYLLHFICSEALIQAGKTPSSLQSSNLHVPSQQQVLLNQSQPSSQNYKQVASLSTISEQVNSILLKGKLEQSIMNEHHPSFTALMSALLEKIFECGSKKGDSSTNGQQGSQSDSRTSKNSGSSNDSSCLSAAKDKLSSAGNLIDEEKESDLASTASKKAEQNSSSLLSPVNSSNQIAVSFSSQPQLEKLSKLLEREINSYGVFEEHEFLQKEEEFKQSLTTPKPKPISSMLFQQGPPGVTKDYQECKYQNNNLQPTNVHIPKKTLTFNDDVANLNLNSKLSDFERPLPSPVGPYGNQQQLGGGLADVGFIAQPMTPKMPNDIYKMPNTRNHLNQNANNIPSTPVSTALDNSKWINMYSKSDPTKKIDELMNKIDREYKVKLMDEVSSIARDVYFFSKKKNDIISDGIEYKVQKTISFFQNVLEKMICDEESRNCKEIVLIQLLENKNFIFSLLANCIMTTCYVKDIKGITLDLVVKQSKITSLDYWRVISNFAKFDKHMPEAIKEQLFNQEKQILLYTIWEEKDNLIQNALKNFQEDQNKNHNYEKVICKRLISHSATRVKEISKVLDLNEEIQEKTWEALLYVYRNQLQLMTGRYVDQIIICSIYALKLIKSDLFKDKEIKFKGMISACENLLHFNTEKVKRTTSETGEGIDIINFYNKIYLIPMKVYFKSTNADSHANPHNQQILNLSLNKSIPQNFINYTPLLKDEMMYRVAMTPTTPYTQKLTAVENINSPMPVSHNNFIFARKQLANRSQFMQTGNDQQNIFASNNNNLSTPSGSKLEYNKPMTKTVTVLGQNYSSASIENINGNSEKKSSRKLNFEGDEKTTQVLQFFDNPNNNNNTNNNNNNLTNQSSVGGTPTLEQKQSSPATNDVSPKFGCINSSNSFGLNQSKKFLEDSVEDLNNNNNNNVLRTLKRCNSLFGPKNLNFNSDEENIPSKTSKTNTNNESNGKNTNANEDH